MGIEAFLIQSTGTKGKRRSVTDHAEPISLEIKGQKTRYFPP
jgi:hypothetical protein